MHIMVWLMAQPATLIGTRPVSYDCRSLQTKFIPLDYRVRRCILWEDFIVFLPTCANMALSLPYHQFPVDEEVTHCDIPRTVIYAMKHDTHVRGD